MFPPYRYRFEISALLLALSSSASQAVAYQVGETVDPTVLSQLTAHPDRTIVVDFFAAWCESCRKELPEISNLNSRTDPEKVVIIGIDTDDSLDVATAFQQEMKAKGALNFPVVNDLDQAMVGHFKPKGFPALYIIKNGKVASAHLGATPSIDAVIEKDLTRIAQQ